MLMWDAAYRTRGQRRMARRRRSAYPRAMTAPARPASMEPRPQPPNALQRIADALEPVWRPFVPFGRAAQMWLDAEGLRIDRKSVV